jgi:hypothetical protein
MNLKTHDQTTHQQSPINRHYFRQQDQNIREPFLFLSVNLDNLITRSSTTIKMIGINHINNRS